MAFWVTPEPLAFMKTNLHIPCSTLMYFYVLCFLIITCTPTKKTALWIFFWRLVMWYAPGSERQKPEIFTDTLTGWCKAYMFYLEYRGGMLRAWCGCTIQLMKRGLGRALDTPGDKIRCHLRVLGPHAVRTPRLCWTGLINSFYPIFLTAIIPWDL